MWRPRICIRSLERASGSAGSRGVTASLVMECSIVFPGGSSGARASFAMEVVSSCWPRRRGGRMGPWTEERSKFR